MHIIIGISRSKFTMDTNLDEIQDLKKLFYNKYQFAFRK